MTQVQYIGYIVDEHGVHVNPAKIQSIRDCPTPTTLTGFHSFLGLATFYRRFVLRLSHIAWALNQVTKGGGKAKFVWSESQKKIPCGIEASLMLNTRTLITISPTTLQN